MPELRNRAWRITTIPVIPDGGGPPQALVRHVEAAYPVTEDGWTVLKDRDHKPVYQVRSDRCLDMQRLDATTTDHRGES